MKLANNMSTFGLHFSCCKAIKRLQKIQRSLSLLPHSTVELYKYKFHNNNNSKTLFKYNYINN